MRSPTPPPRRRSRDRIGLAAIALAIATAGGLVWHRALGTFFSQDDFARLGSTLGLAPRLRGPWRYLGHQLAFDLLRPLAGLNPAPYHLVSLATHLGCALLLFGLLERRVSRSAALAGAIFFAVHPALFDAVYWISTLADGLALLLALAALSVLERPGGGRWLAVPFFALSLLSKESTLLLPAAALWLCRGEMAATGRPPAPARAGAGPVLIVMFALSAAYLAYFAASGYPTHLGGPRGAAGEASAGTAAYSLGVGAGLLWNFLSLTGWVANFTLPSVVGFTDAIDPPVYPWAAGAILLWLAGLRSPALRRNGWVMGGILYLTLVLPVLPLAHHTYHYYLEAPMAGAAWCVGALVETATGRLGAMGRRVAAAAVCALLVWNGYALVLKIETMPFLAPELRAEPMVDRARIARRVHDDLAASNLPAGTRLCFWSPSLVALGQAGRSGTTTGETYMERNLKSALFDGLAVRVMFPAVDSVTFVRKYASLPPPWRYAVYRLDGSLRVAASAELDTVLEHSPPGRGAPPPG